MTVIGSLTPSRTSVLVSVAGELDLVTGPAFCDALTDVSLANEDVVADVSRLEFCDCAGLNALIRTRRWVAAHGARLWVHGVPPHLARLLALTGSNRAIERCDRPPARPYRCLEIVLDALHSSPAVVHHRHTTPMGLEPPARGFPSGASTRPDATAC